MEMVSFCENPPHNKTTHNQDEPQVNEVKTIKKKLFATSRKFASNSNPFYLDGTPIVVLYCCQQKNNLYTEFIYFSNPFVVFHCCQIGVKMKDAGCL